MEPFFITKSSTGGYTVYESVIKGENNTPYIKTICYPARFSFALKVAWPELPFMDRVGVVFMLCLLLAVLVSLIENKGRDENAVQLSDVGFATSGSYKVSTVAVSLILVGFYTTWW